MVMTKDPPPALSCNAIVLPHLRVFAVCADDMQAVWSVRVD